MKAQKIDALADMLAMIYKLHTIHYITLHYITLYYILRRRNGRDHGGHCPSTFRPKLLLKYFPTIQAQMFITTRGVQIRIERHRTGVAFFC